MMLGVCAIAQAEAVVVRLPNGVSISLGTGGGPARALPNASAPGSHGGKVSVDPVVARHLQAATEVVAVAGRAFSQAERTFLVLGVARSSVARPGTGYCGAGTEDELVLFEWRPSPGRLELRDRLPIQSCLKSMELQSDRGTALRVVLGGIDEPARFTLTWLQHPQYGPATRTVTVDQGKFVLSP